MSKDLETFVYIIAHRDKFGNLIFTDDVFASFCSARDKLSKLSSMYEIVKVPVHG